MTELGLKALERVRGVTERLRAAAQGLKQEKLRELDYGANVTRQRAKQPK